MPAPRSINRLDVVLDIKQNYRPRQCSMGALARKHQVSKGTVQKIVNGQAYKEIR